MPRTYKPKRPYLNAKELMLVFDISYSALKSCIHRGTFPIPIYHINGKIAADKAVVRRYFREKRKWAMKQLEEDMKSVDFEKDRLRTARKKARR